MNSVKIFFRRYLFTAVCCALFLMTRTSDLYAESVFFKDGRITEGSIISDTDKIIKFKNADGKVSEIFRQDVLRIVIHTDYKTKRYIYKTDSVLVEAFIVDEDKSTYTYRIDLNTPLEYQILKSEIETISRKKIEFASDKKDIVLTREENIVTRASRLRFAYSFSNEFSELDKKRMSVYMDLFLYRMRDNKGNGFDLFTRASLKNFEGDSEMLRADAESIAADYGYEVPGTAPSVQLGTSQIGVGGGLRYINGFYLADLLWQGYLTFSVMHAWDSFTVNANGTYSNDSELNSYIGGAGVEVGIFSYFGVFAETTYAYTPAAKNYAGLLSFYFGAAFRTSFL